MALTKEHYIGGVIGVFLGLLIIWLGHKYWGWFGGTKADSKKDGSPCTTTAGTSGTYTNGVCTDAGGAPGGGPTNTGDKTTYVPVNPIGSGGPKPTSGN